MTVKEALEYLDAARIEWNEGYAYQKPRFEALGMAIEALKAQEPVEPQEKREGDYKNLYCGACGRGIVGYVGNLTGKHLRVSDYCCRCGRAVKWE